MLAYWIKISIASVYLLLMIRCGLRSRPGFASWHMFVVANRCHLDLRVKDAYGRSAVLDVWRYLPRTAFAMDRNGLEFFLIYLRVFHGLLADGTAELHSRGEDSFFVIKDSHVVNS